MNEDTEIDFISVRNLLSGEEILHSFREIYLQGSTCQCPESLDPCVGQADQHPSMPSPCLALSQTKDKKYAPTIWPGVVPQPFE